MRKWISVLLAFALLLPVLTTGGKAAEEDLESEIEQQVSAYIASLGTPNASGARNKLTNHALLGKGAYLHMEASDVFTVATLNSNLMRTNLTETLTEAVRYVQSCNMDTLYLAGSMNWYDDKMSFSNDIYPNPVEDMTNTDLEDNANWIRLNLRDSQKDWEFHANACDSSMVDVVGGARTRITLRRTSVTPDTVTCHVTLKLMDDFDFDGSQTVGTLIGNWVTGSIIDTYSWDVTLAFSFTVSNPCIHRSADYRWDFEVLDVVSDISEGTEKNPLTKIQPKKADGTLNKPYYQMEKNVRLYHDRPWVVEFRVKGGGALCISSTKSFQENVPFLFKLGYRVQGGYPEKYMIYDEETEKDVARYDRHVYGVNFKDLGYSYAKWLTYRIENRVAEDGGNMAYLLIDGTEIGPMVQYEQQKHDEENGATIYVDMESTGEWFDGVDFALNYIGNSNYKLFPGTEIEFIQIWENGEGNGTYSYFESTTAAPSCTEPGKTVHTCALCGASYFEETSEPLGHTLETLPGTPATCETDGLTEGAKCTTCGEVVTAQEVIPALEHTAVTDAAVSATCTADGLTEGSHCSACGTVLTAQEVVTAMGHSWGEGEMSTQPTVNAPGIMAYTCTVCGETKEEEVLYEAVSMRIAGDHRYETAFLTADQMKINLGIEKFDNIIVASGTNFADALSGSYLAAVKNSPILLACNVDSVNDLVKDYIKANLNEGGTVYILGGEGAVPASFEANLDSFVTERLAGDNRFLTNLDVLEEAGAGEQPILVCTGLGFADSLSASASKLPILLVYGDTLMEEQAAFLEAVEGSPLYIIGGDGAVSIAMQDQLSRYGSTTRLAGSDRFETSVMIAETFFDEPESAVLAYASDFPDGLCGGPLAATMNAPLILTMEKYETQAAEYAQTNAIAKGVILGGEKLIPESSAAMIFGQ